MSRKSKSKRRDQQRQPDAPTVRPAEELLISVVPELSGGRTLCRSLGRAQFAAAVGRFLPEATVNCHFLDRHLAERAAEAIGDVPNVEVDCTADPADGPFDVVAYPFTKNGEAELARDLMQAGHDRLADGGRMIVSVDNHGDSWLHDEMQKLFEKVTVRREKKVGAIYLATKRGPLKRPRSFDCEFAFRDGERLVKAFTRPGVFSHRRLDLGARALLEAVSVESGDRVLDLGCGAGAIGIALALREEDVHVVGVDSNPRALQCTERSAELNGLDRIRTQLTADGNVDEPGTFDLVVANPPYFSNFAIATVFLEGAERAVKPGGCIAVVTRQPDWFVERMSETLTDIAVAEVRSYFVVAGTAPTKP